MLSRKAKRKSLKFSAVDKMVGKHGGISIHLNNPYFSVLQCSR